MHTNRNLSRAWTAIAVGGAMFIVGCSGSPPTAPRVTTPWEPTLAKSATGPRYTFRNFARHLVGAKGSGPVPMIPAAAWANRMVQIDRMTSNGSAAAQSVWRVVTNDPRMAIVSRTLARYGCAATPLTNTGFVTTINTTWTATDRVGQPGWPVKSQFSTTSLALTCGAKYSANLLIAQQDGSRTALRIAVRDMARRRNAMVEELKFTRDGRSMDVAKCSLGDCWIRSPEGVTMDVASGVGKAIEAARLLESDRPVDGLMHRLFDARENTGLPDAFAGWYVIARIENMEEDLPGYYSPLKSSQTFRAKRKDNFFERVLRSVDDWFDKNQTPLIQQALDAISQAALNYLGSTVNGKMPTAEDNVRAPR